MITLTDLKAALHIKEADTTHDDYLTELEAAAVDFVQRRTGWYIGPEVSHEYVVKGSGNRVLYLPEKASAITALSSRAYLGGTETVIATGDSDGWVLRLPPGESHGMTLVRKGGHIWDEHLEYVVTATIGYTETVVPLEPGPNHVAAPADDRADVMGLVTLWFEMRLPVSVGTIAPAIPLHIGDRLRARKRARI